MSNLQDLIERIVESKVNSVLEENARRKARRKDKRNREKAEGDKQLRKGGDYPIDFLKASKEDKERVPIHLGRFEAQFGSQPRSNVPKSFPHKKAIEQSVEAETGKYSHPRFGKIWARGDIENKARGKLGLKTVHGPKGKLP